MTTNRGTKHQRSPRSVRPGLETRTVSRVIVAFFEGDKDPLGLASGERSPPVRVA